MYGIMYCDNALGRMRAPLMSPPHGPGTCLVLSIDIVDSFATIGDGRCPFWERDWAVFGKEQRQCGGDQGRWPGLLGRGQIGTGVAARWGGGGRPAALGGGGGAHASGCVQTYHRIWQQSTAHVPDIVLVSGGCDGWRRLSVTASKRGQATGARNGAPDGGNRNRRACAGNGERSSEQWQCSRAVRLNWSNRTIGNDPMQFYSAGDLNHSPKTAAVICLIDVPQNSDSAEQAP
ncbi:hypothetical protein GGX14DRAFT_396289 [Mycena pura]|uniref:Uncharacterized protein n=1 Tax=Mycena pura TaxID=153505 RepID=A0AAD6VEC9_9AGAR|nr:hypothetical protein GGX14DRAFT_396289 [Mycena pura]